MKKDLSISFGELIAISRKLCSKYGIYPPSEYEIYCNYYADIPIPILIEENGVRIWLDRYYAAYQIANGPVSYVYLTKTHIYEEKFSYNNKRKLPKDILSSFNRALNLMRRKNTKTWTMNSAA